jgi:D-sedoheptulose 7-phosphate isomerase
MGSSLWFKTLADIISKLEISSRDEKQLDLEDGFNKLVKKTLDLKRANKRIFLIGNGASASMASHIAADLCKNAHIKVDVFTDLALITALVNDLGVEAMFAEPLKRQALPGDILFAISSSGNSPNLIHAVNAAKNLNLYVATLTAMSADNKLRSLGDLNFYIPAPTYGFAESGHASILHCWVDKVTELSAEKRA